MLAPLVRWMYGELSDRRFGTTLYDQHSSDAGYIFVVAFVIISIYYCILKPLSLTSTNDKATDFYDTKEFKVRFSFFFKNWREYENAHIMFWIGKDLAWNMALKEMWVCFFVPAFLIALDFTWVSMNSKSWATLTT